MSAAAVDLRELRNEYANVRATTPRGSHEAREAFERLFREAARQGEPLDQLHRHTKNEVERFFARTIPGPDGHVYWDGARYFARNDGRSRSPLRWWWAHTHGVEPGQYEDIVITCGEVNCINPEHAVKDRGLRRLRFSRQQMLGSLHVAALRLGRTPKSTEWDTLGLSPTQSVYRARFGSWERALREAGLPPIPVLGRKASPESCIAALRFVRGRIGHWPTRNEFGEHRDALQAEGLPSSKGPIVRYLGPYWRDAIHKASKA